MLVTRRAIVGAAVSACATSVVARAASGAQATAVQSIVGVAPSLRRGINLHHLLNWPQATPGPDHPVYVWPPFSTPNQQVSSDELHRLRTIGFDFIRLTVDPAIFLDVEGARFDELVAIVRARTRQLLDGGFSVIFDLAPVAQDPRFKPERLVDAAEPERFSAYAALVGRLAGLLDDMPHDRFALELFNEPPLVAARGLAHWQVLAETLHERARSAAPNLPLVMTGANWDDSKALMQLDTSSFKGSNLLYTFHYYTPHPFTHQGVENLYTRDLRGLRWPPRFGQRADVTAKSMAALDGDSRFAGPLRAAETPKLAKTISDYFGSDFPATRVDRDFADVSAWARRIGVPPSRILLGEFGAVRRGDMTADQLGDRLHWLTAVRQAAERQGFSWAYWVYEGYGGMSLVDDLQRHTMYADDLAALGLNA